MYTATNSRLNIHHLCNCGNPMDFSCKMQVEIIRKTLNQLQNIFCNCCLASPLPTLDHCRGDKLTNLMLITRFLISHSIRRPREGTWVGWFTMTDWQPSGTWTGSLPVLLYQLNPLSATLIKVILIKYVKTCISNNRVSS